MGSPVDFDFWLGTWRAVWGDDGAHGTNTITKEYGDRVANERFDGRPGADFTGHERVGLRRAGRLWRQTWVDDSFYYVPDLTGRQFEDGEMTLLCRDTYRMRFFEVTDTSFQWTWERRAGDGPGVLRPGRSRTSGSTRRSERAQSLRCPRQRRGLSRASGVGSPAAPSPRRPSSAPSSGGCDSAPPPSTSDGGRGLR